MAKSRLFNLRLDDKARGLWQAAADEAGMSLAAFVKAAVEAWISRDRGGYEPQASGPPPTKPPPQRSDSLASASPKSHIAVTVTSSPIPVEVVGPPPRRARPKLTALPGGKVFKGPDPKPGKGK